MELRHLRYFVTLAEELHFGRAAQRLHIAQPPLSQQIRQLELELGFELFHRTKRMVQLTEAGQVFLTEVKRVLEQLDQAIQIAQQTSRGEAGRLVIGFVSSASYNVLPKILRIFRKCVPSVVLELRELTTNEQLQWLREGRIDVGFLRPPVEEALFSTETIFREMLVVALPEGHRLAHEPQVFVSSLCNEPFILFPRRNAPGVYDNIISLCQQAGFSPKVSQEAIEMQTIVSLVAAEMGVAIVPASLQNLQRTGVIYKTLEEPSPEVAINIIWKCYNTSPTLQRFLEVVRQVFQKFK
ncbi:LysR family transcriptional regulator [Aetokthonos hydrillicola Thurmond2011]|jgi:DNA-binding transcriptional LysR family regulator|uniref:LysR family transcriptional regulator n=1 Tax=Aetokthonos hydrillicola Thurmond2011 TaxID=2712845 RepID=A0AAP5IDR7_9CYAN|nr:LysR family transcriptional regulator [Aetokthonos hydrillicola]MBO3463937.1 LysR family transcriptional regulator [Aetokthonos hydrillicola CCALA 1050]MBW4590416.1 LysR family transcriptional regulator [Aetokthonos hydrillicola CCALA 1050]MDR9899756.1 LysR family transcriptional regulator [Aetokthonos hydrillicola Thurmond2011]